MTARITQQLKASRYSKVFSLVLQTVSGVQVRMSAGSEFHRCGAANEKARLANVVHAGTCNSGRHDDLSD